MIQPAFLVLRRSSFLQRNTRAFSTNPSAVNPQAQSGFGKGTNELYDRVKSSPPLNIVEIGAGSGIFTRAMLAHPEWSSSIGRLKAIDPSEGMREVFSKTIKDDRVTVADGVFEHSGVEDGWADLVVIAQALHWASDLGAAMAENARILKPNSILACIWNLDNRDAAQWLAQVRDRIERYDKGAPHARHGLWRQAFDTPSYVKSFNPPEEEVFSYNLPRTLDKVTSRALSSSYVAALPDDERVKIKRDVEGIIKKGDDKVWIDESRGIFEYPLKTTLVISRRK